MIYISHPIAAVEVGTMVEIYRARGVIEVCVVVSANPLTLRKAMPYELFRCETMRRKIRMGEFSAAAEAAEAVMKAMTR